MDIELINRAKMLMISDEVSEEEIIYLGYIINNYVDNPEIRNKIHLNDVCYHIENRLYNKDSIKTR